MKKEDLINKWLNHSLSEEEWKAFKNLDAFPALDQIDSLAKSYKAPRINIEENYAQIHHRKKASNLFSWSRFSIGIAAILVIGLSLLFFLNPSEISQIAIAQETKTFSLPDSSEVVMNSGSTVTYNESDWQDDRHLDLDGEAFFRVAKGKTFTVHTENGTIEVLGTQFNVFSREDLFTVTCYEGKVKVLYGQSTIYLTQGESYSNMLGKSSNLHELNAPNWINGTSDFQSTPYHFVIEELERQFGVIVQYPTGVKNSKFTGSFSNKNLEAALQAITIPFNLEFSIEGSTVMLKEIP